MSFYFFQQRLAYIVLDYISGKTLQEKLNDGHHFTVEESVHVIEKLAKAIEHSHQKGIVHRDLKPSNVMLNDQGQPILMDFGIARIENSDPLTITGSVLGSVAYMSPEQANGDKVDPRTDIYSLGVILYRMLSGRLPFSGEAVGQVIAKILLEPPPDMHQFDSRIPQTLVDIVNKAMQKKRDQRYASSTEFIDKLNAFVRSQQTNTPFLFYAPIPKHPKTISQPVIHPLAMDRPWLPWGIVPVVIILCIIGLVVLAVAVPSVFRLFNSTPTPTTTPLTPVPETPSPVATQTETRISGPGLDVSPSVTPPFPGETSGSVPIILTPTLIPTSTNTPTPRPPTRPSLTSTSEPANFAEPDSPTPVSSPTSQARSSPTIMILTLVEPSTIEPTKSDDKDK